MIFQWGVVTNNGVLQTFPIAFTVQGFAVNVTANMRTGRAVAANAYNINNISAMFYAESTNAPFAGWYHAVGV